MSRRRFILALVISPMVPLGLSFFAILSLLAQFARPGDIWDLARHLLAAAPQSYVASLSIGGLTAFVLSSLERLTLVHVLACSCVFGALSGIAYDFLIYWPRMHEVLVDAPISGVFGGIAGLLVSGSFVAICGTEFWDLPVRWRYVLPLLVSADIVWIAWLGWQAVELRQFEDNIAKTTTGMPQDQVVELLGEPNAPSRNCSYYIKPPFNCSTTLSYEGPLGSHADFFLDDERRVIGAIKPR